MNALLSPTLGAALLFIPVASASAAVALKAGAKPKILFRFAADQRHDMIHAFGNDAIRTPNLRRVVCDGVTLRPSTSEPRRNERAQLLTRSCCGNSA